MAQVSETLAQLLERRLLEMGKRRGRGEKVSLNELYGALPADGDWVSYETIRRVREVGHHNIGRKAAITIATMIDVDVEDVQRAAGQRPTLGPFQLPERADGLNHHERSVVLGVIDAILDAAQPAARGRSGPAPLRAVANRGDSDDAAKVDDLARDQRRRQTGSSRKPDSAGPDSRD